MRLYEFEAKDLAKKYGIHVPKGEVISSSKELDILTEHGVVKAQTLNNRRLKSNGILFCTNREELKKSVDGLIGGAINNERVQKVLVEERVDTKKEFYASITYDSHHKTPVLILSKDGGVDIEDNGSDLAKIPISPMVGLQNWQIRRATIESGVNKDQLAQITEIMMKAYDLFCKEDARLVEINPLSETRDGKIVAVGLLIDLDDDASYKHKDRLYPPRQIGIGASAERERLVKEANIESYQGTVKYVEFDGDIGFLAAGGGGSLACMDVLLRNGGVPANYSEHSGDPTREKVYRLTKTILSKPGLNGLWIVGSIANFTRIDVTMQGIVDALIETNPKFPIVVRRSGPYEKEGLQILRDVAVKNSLNVEIHGSEVPITTTAKTIVQKSKQYKEGG